MSQFPYLVKVKCYYDGQNYNEYIICYGKSFSDVTRQVEDYYGDELETCQVTVLADAGSFVSVTRQTANELIAGEGCQKDGQEVLTPHDEKM